MKIFILLIGMILYFPNVYAGGSRVGTLRTDGTGQGNMSIINPQLITELGRIKTDPTIRIIHGTPSLNGVSRISVGRINQNQWQVQTIDIPDDLLTQSDLSQQIQKSIELNDWVEIQPANP